MKILYITNYQGPHAVAQRNQRRNRTLGPSRKVELIASGLSRRQHEVTVVSAATVAERTLRWHPGMEVTEAACGAARVVYLGGLDAPKLNLIVAGHLLKRYLANAPPFDVVLLYNLEWYFLRPTLDYARRMGRAVVVEYEDDALIELGARMKAWHRARGRKAIEAARADVDGVIAVSPGLQRQLGIDNSIVIPGLVGEDMLAIPRDFGSDGDRPLRIVYTGGMTREKGPDILVEAVSHLGFPVELDIVGNGRDLPLVREIARRSKAVVRVHGELSREAMVEILARADIAVNPHRMTTGMLGQIFPFKVVEYIGAGLPVVTSRLGEFPLPDQDSLLVYEEDTCQGLAEALTRAQARLPHLRQAASRARTWVEAEYSSLAAGQKAELVLRAAMVSRSRRAGICG